MSNKYLSVLKLMVAIILAGFTSGLTVDGQDNSELVSRHYVLPSFVKGTVLLKSGKTQTAMMNYNMITEEMIFENGSTRLAMDNLEKIDTIYLDSMRFVPHNKIFYEVLINDRISLFKKHKSNLLQSGAPAGYGGTSETSATTSISILAGSGALYKLQLPQDYHVKDASQFWISKENTESIVTSQKQFLKIFPEKSKELEQFIKQKKLNVRKQEDLIILIKKCNELMR